MRSGTPRWAGLAAAAGGVMFSAFWASSLLKVDVLPWGVALLWHFVTTVLLAAGATGVHLATRGPTLQSAFGWAGLALVIGGQLISLEVTMLGLVAFGGAAIAPPSLPRWAGAALAIGAVAFLVTTALQGPFWGDPNPTPPLVPSVAFLAALALIALAWIGLGLVRRPA